MTHDLHRPCVLLGGLRCAWNQSEGALRDSGCYMSGSSQCSICQCRPRWWGVADGAFSRPLSAMTDSSPVEAHTARGRFVFLWWCPPRTGHGCFPPHGSGGLEEPSGLEGAPVVSSNANKPESFFFFENLHKYSTTKTDHRWTRGSAHGSGSVSPLQSHVRLSCTPAWLGRQRPVAGWSGL